MSADNYLDNYRDFHLLDCTPFAGRTVWHPVFPGIALVIFCSLCVYSLVPGVWHPVYTCFYILYVNLNPTPEDHRAAFLINADVIDQTVPQFFPELRLFSGQIFQLGDEVREYLLRIVLLLDECFQFLKAAIVPGVWHFFMYTLFWLLCLINSFFGTFEKTQLQIEHFLEHLAKWHCVMLLCPPGLQKINFIKLNSTI